MKTLVLFTAMMFFGANVHASQIKQPAGRNDLFNFDSGCQLRVNAVKSDSRIHKNDRENLQEDLFLLDNALKIITNEREDADFRLQVFSTAETFRQSLIYSLEKIKFVDESLAKAVIKSCGLENIMKSSLGAQLPELLEKLINEADGVDPENGT